MSTGDLLPNPQELAEMSEVSAFFAQYQSFSVARRGNVTQNSRSLPQELPQNEKCKKWKTGKNAVTTYKCSSYESG